MVKEDLSENNIQFVGYGVETCPETKKMHHQGWLYCSTDAKKSFKAWKKLFAKLGLEKMHFEQMKGSFAQNTAYVSKEGTLIEIGVKPMENGKKRKLLEFKEAIDEGKNVLEIADSPSLFGTFLQYRSGLIYIFIYIYIYIYFFFIYEYIYIYMNIYIYIYVYSYMYIYIHMSQYMVVISYICIYIYIYIYILYI